ncbi:MAG: ATP-binding cassette domain-containing protein [Anaerolineaceae bacterium]|nr:ATP-binding cassette domain-containing protein [Anaerolineaceae bacterium]MBN2676907.1 ATP-binding cassette domain-containing protein [Anaerolineaceae bacterium]
MPGIIGTNGSGKSTRIQTIAGIINSYKEHINL